MAFTNPYRGLRGLPADVWIIAATTLVNRAGMMALPFLVLYLTRYLGISASAAGLAISAYGVGGLVTAPVAGRLADRFGPYAVIRASPSRTQRTQWPPSEQMAQASGVCRLTRVAGDRIVTRPRPTERAPSARLALRGPRALGWLAAHFPVRAAARS